MPTDPKLEQYLSALDKALGQIPVSDRSDIITEIKSHILEAKDRDPDADIKQILASLGEPETVANRYLLERGLKPGRPSRSPIIKWLTIGFLGTFGIFTLLIVALVWRFTPLLKVDEDAGRVILLGGLVDIDEKAGKLHIGGTTIHHDEATRSFDGSAEIPPNKYKQVLIKFSNGKMDFRPSTDQKIHWRCRVEGGNEKTFVEEGKQTFSLKLDSAGGVKCTIDLPPKVATTVDGANGKVDIDRPQAPLELKLDNGKVDITPDSRLRYSWDSKVVNGFARGLENDADPNLDKSKTGEVIPIKISVTNGYIKKGRE